MSDSASKKRGAEAPLPRGGARLSDRRSEPERSGESAPLFGQDKEKDTKKHKQTKKTDKKKKGNREEEQLEQESKKKKSKKEKKSRDHDDDDDDDDDGLAEDVTAPVVKHGRSAKTVSARTLERGALLLGLVAEASSHALFVDLPHGLRARVDMRESQEQEDQRNHDDDDDDDDDRAAADEMYAPGDVLVVAVVTAKPLVVSLDPALVCQFQLMQKKARVGQMVVGRIASSEDHGWTVQVPHFSKPAFLPRTEVESTLAPRLRVGRVVTATVVSAEKNLVKLSQKTDAQVPKDAALSDVLPGMLATKLVLSAARQPEDGWRVQFGHNVEGDLHWTQLPSRTLPVASLVPGSSGRVLWVSMDRGCTGLSQLPWLVSSPISSAPIAASEERVFKGRVMSVSGKRGVWLLVHNGVPALAPVRLVTDDKEAVVESLVAPGTVVACRLVRTPSLLDGSPHVGLAESILHAKWLLSSELEAGQLCSVVVEKVHKNGSAVAVLDKSAGQLRGFLPATHARGVDLKKGLKLECRVFNTLPASNRDLPVLTALKRLVRDSDQPLVPDRIKTGAWGSGLVLSVKPTFAILSLYEGKTGLLPLSEMSFAYLKSADEVVHQGEVVRCRVHSTEKNKLILSLLPERSQDAANLGGDADTAVLPQIGSIVETAVVMRVLGGGGGVEVEFGDSKTRGVLSEQHFSDWPRLAAAQARSLVEGAELRDLVVWGLDKKKKVALLTAKQSYRELRAALPRTTEELVDGMALGACVVEGDKGESGLALKVWGDLGVFCFRDRLTDGYLSAKDAAAIEAKKGLTLVGRVASKGNGSATVRCGLSTQPEDLGYLLKGYLMSCLAVWPAGLEAGSEVAATVVTRTSEGGARLRLRGSDLVLYEAFCRTAPAEWQQGREVRVVVLLCDPCTSPPVLDVVAAENMDWKTKGKVLLLSPEVAVLSAGSKKRLVLALARPEWSQTALSRGGAPSIAVGDVLSQFEKSSVASPAKNKRWLLAARLPGVAAAAALTATSSAKEVSATTTNLVLGKLYELTVDSIAQHHMNVSKSSGEKGRIHLSELVEDDSDADRAELSRFKSGGVVRAVYIGYRVRERKSDLVLSHGHQSARTTLHHHFSLRLKRHAIGVAPPTSSVDAAHGSWLSSVPVYGSVQPGAVLPAVVTEVAQMGLWLHVAPFLRGRMFALDASTDADVVASLDQHMPSGTRMMVRVTAVDSDSRELDLVREPLVAAVAQEGATVLCRVTKVEHESALLQYGSHSYARLHELDVDDVVHADSALKVLPEPGSFVYATLARLAGREQYLDATTRPSVTGVAWSEDDKKSSDSKFALRPWGPSTLPEEGSLIAGRIVNSGRGHDGVFVGLGQGMTARCPMRLLSDDFVESNQVAALFPVGKRVLCRVMSSDTTSGRVEVALKQSLCKRGQLLTATTVRVGQVLHCDVNKVDEKLGLFLTVRGGLRLSGLAHKSQLFDGPPQSFASTYEKGDYVLAKVISVDKGKIGFTIKPSAFSEQERLLKEDDDEEEEDEDQEEEEEEKEVQDEEEEEEKDDDDEKKNEEKKKQDKQTRRGVLPASVGFFEDDEDGKGASASGSSSASSSDEERVGKKRERAASAGEVEEREKALAKRSARAESDGDFERLLMAEPNNSEIWVRWMAHKLSQSDVDAARIVAARGLQRIASTLRKERANVWTALVNLEAKYGDETSLADLVVRGARELGRLEMDLRVIDALERDGGSRARCDEAVAGLLSRHGTNADAWLRAGQVYIRRGDGGRSSELLQKALRQVQERDARVLMASKWAQTEFREGAPERGKTIFFSLLDNYPKRIDVLVVFLDMEEKARDWEAARALYKRATALHLSSKKMRYFLRRWLDFEKLHGDERDQQLVVDTAKAFVDSKKKDDSSD